MDVETQEHDWHVNDLEFEIFKEKKKVKKNNLIEFIYNLIFFLLYIPAVLIGTTEFYRIRKKMWVNYNKKA
jgi:hypothetical protein